MCLLYSLPIYFSEQKIHMFGPNYTTDLIYYIAQ
jgi:hypothetical protein